MKKSQIYQTSKQAILKRMLNIAIRLTGVRQIELLDPVIAVISESLAEEVYKIARDIHDVEHRMLEAIMEILCPDLSLCAHPSHCILHVIQEESVAFFNRTTPFILKDKRYLPTGRHNEMRFHPVGNMVAYKGHISYVMHDGLCYSVDSDLTKNLLFRSRNKMLGQSNSYWIGIHLDDQISNIENFSFYFDLPQVSDKDQYLKLLQFASFKLNGLKLKTKKGIHNLEEPILNRNIGLFSKFEVSRQLDEKILNEYNKHFITLLECIQFSSAKRIFPNVFSEFFSEELLQEFIEPLLWFEIEHPLFSDTALAESLIASINAFPVANKCLCKKNTTIDGIIQAIPLVTDNNESFLSIESVTDSRGRAYYELPFPNSESEEYLTYTLRRGGYERYNKREAKEYLSVFLGKLKKEASSELEKFDDDAREEISQYILDLSKQMKKAIGDINEILEIQNYILIDGIPRKDIFFLNYWLTECERGNGIKTGTSFHIDNQECPHLIVSRAFNLSISMGGRQAPLQTEKQSLRMQTLTRQKMLITNDEIISFCQQQFGDIIENTDIHYGIAEDAQGVGFMRTIDVFVTPKKDTPYLLDDKDLQFIKILLEKNSSETFSYRIFINKDN